MKDNVAGNRSEATRAQSPLSIWDAPAYSVADAARYLMLPIATLRSWVAGRYYPTQEQTKKHWQPLIHPPVAESPLFLSFRNLAEGHVLATLRRRYRIDMEKVRSAIQYIEKRLGDPHPLVNPSMRTDGVSLFLDKFGPLENASEEGQLAIREILEASLKRLDWGPSGAIRLFPFTRPESIEQPKLVVIDPQVAFGRPVITGTRIPTRSIFERWVAGDSIEALCKDFERRPEEVEEAIRCEQLKEAA
jgi:uncharacterized protein (DUF433 family)